MLTRIVLLMGTVMLLFSFSSNAAEGDWMKFNQGLSLAEKQSKVVLIDFYTSWCHWCKVMDEKTFQNVDVAKRLKERFVTVRVNAENKMEKANYNGKEYNSVELSQTFGITGYPTLAFLESNGTIITKIPGYIPAETFVHILDYIDQKMYEQKMPFEEFMKKNKENIK